ncbi:MAG: DUF4173 domain-containing protein [Acidobacteriota bacterium]
MSEEIKLNKTKVGLGILQAALLIGISGDFLLREMPWGLNTFLWILMVSATFIGLTYSQRREFLNKETLMLHGALLFFAATFLYRASIPLLLLNVLAVFTVAAVLTLPSLKLNPKFSGVSHYLLGFVWSGINLLISPFLLVFNDIKWSGSSDSKWSKTVFPAIRGLLIGLPLLLVFGALFMGADAAFEGLIKRTLNIDTGEIFGHLFLIIFLSWIVAGYLRGTLYGSLIPDQFFKRDSNTETTPKLNWREFNSSWLPSSLNLGKIEISIIWGLMNLLFLTFVIVQLPYLFGGFEYVQNTENVKLADYARRGVAELGLVTVLVLPVLLIGHWFINRENKATEKLFKIMAGIQIGLLFVIMLSSAQRMILYTGSYGYGLTLERFYAMVFLAVLAAIFIWFAGTILSGYRPKFAWGMLWIALFTLGILNITNPEDFVLKTNIQLMQAGRDFDVQYNTHELRDDAVPRLIEFLPNLSERQRCDAENGLNLLDNQTKHGWRLINWNSARWKAKYALDSYKQQNGLQGNWVKNCYQLYPEQSNTR